MRVPSLMPRIEGSDDEALRELVAQLYCQPLTKVFQGGMDLWSRTGE